jgi:hypothetical protein
VKQLLKRSERIISTFSKLEAKNVASLAEQIVNREKKI